MRASLNEHPKASTTLAIILGASEWPHCSLQFQPLPSCARSATHFLTYLLNSFRLPANNLLDLVDKDESAHSILTKISEFLEGKDRKGPICDIILYYTGHGSYGGEPPGNSFFLPVRSTKEINAYETGIPVYLLARLLRQKAQRLRKYVILDCCFAGEALKHFQSEGNWSQTLGRSNFAPTEGTALLCSSGPREVSRAPVESDFTMFSEGLLEVLNKGNKNYASHFTLEDLSTLIHDYLREKYPDNVIRPEIYPADQHAGDITRVPIFPNSGLKTKTEVRDSGTLRSEPPKVVLAYSAIARRIVCFNQGEYLNYSVRASEMVRQYYALSNSSTSHAWSRLRNTLVKHLNDGLGKVCLGNFDLLREYFAPRNKVQPRICVKVNFEREGNQYVTELVRNAPVDYESEYRIEANTGFFNIKLTGQPYLCNNIPERVANNEYVNARIDPKRAESYWQNRQQQFEITEAVDSESWARCWVGNSRGQSCYKSTLIIPITLWNNELDSRFVEVMRNMGADKFARSIFGFLCFDHVREDYFQCGLDSDIGYIVADILSLYLITRTVTLNTINKRRGATKIRPESARQQAGKRPKRSRKSG